MKYLNEESLKLYKVEFLNNYNSIDVSTSFVNKNVNIGESTGNTNPYENCKVICNNSGSNLTFINCTINGNNTLDNCTFINCIIEEGVQITNCVEMTNCTLDSSNIGTGNKYLYNCKINCSDNLSNSLSYVYNCLFYSDRDINISNISHMFNCIKQGVGKITLNNCKDMLGCSEFIYNNCYRTYTTNFKYPIPTN